MRRGAANWWLATIALLVFAQLGVTEPQPSYPYDKRDEHACPLGSYRSQKTLECEPCPKGTYATRYHSRASCAACPSGRTTLREGSLDIKQCVCLPGFGQSSTDSEVCARCPQGTYSFGDAFDVCFECPFPKTTAFTGATSDQDCVCPGGGGSGPDCDQCPKNMVLMSNGVCGCAPGHGGTACDPCQPGFYSTGGKANNPRPVCKPCGLHFTSPPGAIGPAYCQCEAGYGAGNPGESMWQHICSVCPVGTFNPGPGIGDRHIAGLDGYGTKRRLPRASPCRPCNAANPEGGFTTIDVGATSVSQCICAPGFGGPDCSICPTGTFSDGGRDAVCKSCPGSGAGYTTAYQGSTSVTACVCIPGYGMTDSGLCRLCPANTFSEGFSKEDCKPCPFAHTSPPGSHSRNQCVPASQPCPVGQIAPPGAVSSDQCVCLPGHGGSGNRQEPCTPCPAGSWSPGTDTQACIPCGFGYTSPVAATSSQECYPINACPAGTEYPAFLKMPTSADQCVCKAGFGSSNGLAPCHLCPEGTFSEGGTLEGCKPCPFGYQSAAGAHGVHECIRTPQACPIGQWAPKDAVSQEQCACYPGFGGGDNNTAPCDICPAGSFSPGHTRDRCIPCGFGYTSPVGSKEERDCYPVDQCPAGTEVPHGAAGATVKECMCKPGFGSPTGEGTCRLCPTASFSPGGTMEDCRPCPFGTTSRPGAKGIDECVPIPQACPVGQVALLGAVAPAQCVCLPGHGGGRSPSEPCTPCPSGSWSAGIDTQPCIPCGFGYTSPEAATCEEECYPINACPAGTQYPVFASMPVSIDQCVCKPGFGSSSGKGTCGLCPANTFSPGGSMEDCKPCPFGFTSAPGSASFLECKPIIHPCPIGQWAPLGAVSAAECRCYKGFGGGDGPTDPCTLCPPGTYSANIGTERCVPCGFGFTSPSGAMGPEECYPMDQCPTGTQPTDETLDLGGPQTARECVCKAGYGSVTGEGGCHLCPAGTYSKGGSMEDCVPCPFGYTSAPGTTSWKGCVPAAQDCPVGQLAPLGAVSKAECGCLPGHGGGATPTDACSLCPVGTWSSGGDTQPCIPCDFGYTSPMGSTSGKECYPANACPPGTLMPKYGASSPRECVCMPGFGTESQDGPCQLCPSGYFGQGFRREPCLPCPFGLTSAPGSAGVDECVPMAQACPVGQIADPQDLPVSAADCHCLPGFGGGATPQDACSVCQPGTYGPGIGTQPCFPCPFLYTSPIGSITPAACYEVEQCPGGTMPGIDGPSSVKECACIPGFGSPTGRPGDPCFWCPPDTFNEGFQWDGCKQCVEGSWAPAGSSQCYPIGEGPPPTNRTMKAKSHFVTEWQPPTGAVSAYLSSVQPLFVPPQQKLAKSASIGLQQARPAVSLQDLNAIGQLPRRRFGRPRAASTPPQVVTSATNGYAMGVANRMTGPVGHSNSADNLMYSDAATGAPISRTAAVAMGGGIQPMINGPVYSRLGQALASTNKQLAAPRTLDTRRSASSDSELDSPDSSAEESDSTPADAEAEFESLSNSSSEDDTDAKTSGDHAAPESISVDSTTAGLDSESNADNSPTAGTKNDSSTTSPTTPGADGVASPGPGHESPKTTTSNGAAPPGEASSKTNPSTSVPASPVLSSTPIPSPSLVPSSQSQQQAPELSAKVPVPSSGQPHSQRAASQVSSKSQAAEVQAAPLPISLPATSSTSTSPLSVVKKVIRRISGLADTAAQPVDITQAHLQVAPTPSSSVKVDHDASAGSVNGAASSGKRQGMVSRVVASQF